ncbi:MAG: PQQ-dependent sugar dehydrogenase [Aquabacterium sp.]|nr:PQQ-dependent sugar dehydrogenase [Ferruginibacter sp.]
MYQLKKITVFACCVLLTSLTASSNDTTKVKTLLPADTSLVLPEGFSGAKVITDLGRARHMVVATNGDIFVKLEKLKDGKGIYRLHDSNGDGKPDEVTGFGNYVGTGIALKGGWLYASSNSEVFRYKLNESTGAVDEASVQKIITGLVDRGQHNSKSLALDNAGNIYVTIGCPSNACQVQDRTKGSPGQDPCPLLETTGGVWQFKTDKLNQSYPEGFRYATGLRNVVGLQWNSEANELYAMQHGRDQLFQFYPELFTEKEGAENPAEEMFLLKKGSDCGYPYCYYDNDKKQKLLNPEYGGDRAKVDRCAGKVQSILQFPGHLAPNGMLFYTGTKFPAKYKNGAFIAFHGSWNRAPQPQAGYFVVFVPFKNGMPSGEWEVFANGFAGANINKAKYRPCGLAQAPDGSLYVSDDNNGTVWKIDYKAK